MLRVSHLEVGTLASFLRLALARNVAFPIPLDQFRNGALGQHWIQSAHRWQAGQKVIDVGCGYSDLPNLLAKAGCEVWGADDFGLKSGDTYWLRGKHPHDLAKQFPDVRYVFERLGESPSSFPEDYFDVVISNQALHVAKPPHAPIWRDMLRVMKKSGGSEMLVSMICNFGTDGQPEQAIQRLEGIRAMERDILGRMATGETVAVAEFDALQDQAGQSFHRFSPALYVAYVASTLGVAPFAMPAELLAENYCTEVNALIDPASVGFNNARFSNNPDEVKNFCYGRYAPVLMRLTWRDGESVAELPAEFIGWNAIGAHMTMPKKTQKLSILPMGTANPILLQENSENEVHMIACEMNMTADSPLSMSILARPHGRDYLGLWLRGPQNCDDLMEVFFDLANCRVTSRGCYGRSVLDEVLIEPIGDGWMRCSVRGIPSSVNGLARANVLVRQDKDGSSRYVGDTSKGIYLASPFFR